MRMSRGVFLLYGLADTLPSGFPFSLSSYDLLDFLLDSRVSFLGVPSPRSIWAEHDLDFLDCFTACLKQSCQCFELC